MTYRWKWHALVQVCRRWRYIVFASPCRLHLQFRCRATTPVREILDVWPPVQIVVNDYRPIYLDGDNIIAALEHPDRVCKINLSRLTSSLLERLATVMQEPFPVLEHLHLHHYDDQIPLVLPDTFLGGSAPRLSSLTLTGIPFPAVPKLLLSARDLVEIELSAVPHTGYISPEAMVTCLSKLTNLESLILKFQSPSSRPDRESQRPLLPAPIDLPALIKLELQGASEYLEDFLARINTPVLTTTEITFFNRVVFDIPQLFNFFSRTKALGSVKGAQLFFNPDSAVFSVYCRDSPQLRSPDSRRFHVNVLCKAFDWKISFLVQICSQLLPLLSGVEWLAIFSNMLQMDFPDDLDHTQWLEIFRPFIAVQSLDIFFGLDELIAPALQELTGERVMEVLPALGRIYIPDRDPPEPVRQVLEPFITARQLANRPVTVPWQR